MAGKPMVSMAKQPFYLLKFNFQFTLNVLNN